MGWQSYTSAHGGLRRWLQASGSLSARLAATGEVFSVKVVAQGRQPLTPGEAVALGQGPRRLGYAREVLLQVNGKPLVYARSVTTYADSVGAWRSLRGLGCRPLADLLFKRSGIARQPLAFALFPRHSPLQRHVLKSWYVATGAMPDSHGLLARRSVFMRHGAALLVMEVFAAGQPDWRWPDDASLNSSRRRT